MTAEQQRQLTILQGNLAVFLRRSKDASYPPQAQADALVQAQATQRQIKAITR